MMRKLALVAILFLLSFSQNTYAATPKMKNELYCMTQAIYYESKSEPELGQLAVGTVVINRTETEGFPDTVCGVVKQKKPNGCHFTSLCDNPKALGKINYKLWMECEKISQRILLFGERAGIIYDSKALYFHATYIKTSWTKMHRVMKIGGHIFYSDPKRKAKNAQE